MPGLFEQFPHTNLHELNLDWIIDLINQFKEELEDSAVLSVNGQTGHVTLYESENVILPPLPSGVNQWRLVRMMDGQYAGILFYDNHAYIQRGNSTMRLLTLEDIPSDSGVVSWNGLTGVVKVTGADIPVDDAADAESIAQALETEKTERVNADNALRSSINALQENFVNYYTTYPNGKLFNRDTFRITIPFSNPLEQQIVIDDAFVYGPSGSFTNIANKITVETFNKFMVTVAVTFESQYIGELLRIDLTLQQ